MTMRRALLLAGSISLLTTCGSTTPGTFVLVTLAPGTPAPAGVKKITLDLTLGASHTTVPLMNGNGGDIAFPATKSLEIRNGDGLLMIVATGTDATNAQVAMGTGSVTVVRDQEKDTTITMTGMAADLAHLRPDMGTHDFGSVTAGTNSTPFDITFTNDGTAPTTGGFTVSFNGADLALFHVTARTCTTALAVSATCTVSVDFEPPAGTPSGVKHADMQLTADSGAKVIVTLSGTVP